MKIAMVSYNAIHGAVPGWNISGINEVLVLQNSKGEEFAAYQGINSKEEFDKGTEIVKNEIKNSWGVLRESIPTLDHLFLYIGVNGSEEAIRLATKELPPEKVTYVLCSCNIFAKEKLISESGHKDARRISCQCGGQEDLGNILQKFLKTGSLPD
jgi:hypothetical protein